MAQLPSSMVDASGDVAYAYNAAGNVASVTYPSGRVVNRTYDAAGRLTGFETGGVGSFDVTWTADGMVDAVSYPNGVATDYTCDLDGRATDMSVSGSAGGILDLGYGYTPGSLVSSRSTGRDGALPVAETMTWDAVARLSRRCRR
jgi:YD repeat-containing protein